jgi:hypothetical protein
VTTLSGTSAEVAEWLFFVHPDMHRDALSRMRPGRLWRAFLPGAAPRAALQVLGDRAPAALEASLALDDCREHGLKAAGYPFACDVPPAVVAAALLADATRLLTVPGPGPEAFLFSLPDRDIWLAEAEECLDAAASAWPHAPAEPLDVLLVGPESDLRSVIGLADAATRTRFAWGMEACESDLAAFSRSHMRRSASWSLMTGIRSAIEESDATFGRDESGWPIWMVVTGGDASIAGARLLPGLRAVLRGPA